MLSVDFWIEDFKKHSPELVIKAIQQDALASCRILAGQKWRTNSNGEWRAACLSIIKGIKTLEGVQEEEDE